MKNKLRISGGVFKGKILKSLNLDEVRPTLSQVKEAVFDSLAARIDFSEYIFYDLFAGFGSIACEAYSRGFSEVVCVEKSPAVFSILRQNLKSIRAEKVRAVREDAVRFCQKQTFRSPCVVYLDPPYASELPAKIFEALLVKNQIGRHDYIILETDGICPVPDSLRILSQKKHGRATLYFLGLNEVLI